MPFKVNNKLYVILLAITSIVFFISFTLICLFSDNSKVVVITSSIISLSGGGLASVVVAWLIDYSNCRIKNVEHQIRDKNIWEDLKETFDFSCKIFCMSLWFASNKNETHYITDWFDLSIDTLKLEYENEQQKALLSANMYISTLWYSCKEMLKLLTNLNDHAFELMFNYHVTQEGKIIIEEYIKYYNLFEILENGEKDAIYYSAMLMHSRMMFALVEDLLKTRGYEKIEYCSKS